MRNYCIIKMAEVLRINTELIKEQYIKSYNLKVIKIIVNYCNHHNIIIDPSKEFLYKGIDISSIYLTILKSIKSSFDEYYILLSNCLLIKTFIDINYLFDFHYDVLNEYHNNCNVMPNPLTVYKNVKIGSWVYIILQLLNKGYDSIYDKLLSKLIIANKIIDILIRINCVDKLFINILKNMDNNGFDICNDTVYKHIKIGEWFYGKLDRIVELNCPLYSFLNISLSIKNHIDDFLFLKNSKGGYVDMILYYDNEFEDVKYTKCFN